MWSCIKYTSTAKGCYRAPQEELYEKPNLINDRQQQNSKDTTNLSPKLQVFVAMPQKSRYRSNTTYAARSS
jgi:hypothetical protein